MQKYFGTDGIRGVAGEDLTARVAFALGNALCRRVRAPRVVLGRDPRTSSDMLALAFCAGVAAGGGTVLDGGVLPTAAVSFFVRREGADFGVMISASHNPPAYNGLKVFGPDGRKLGDEEEARTEKLFGQYLHAPAARCGRARPLGGRGRYAGMLCALSAPLSGRTFVLDCARGAACAFAPRVFRRLGAKVYALNARPDGARINAGCGALHPHAMRAAVVRLGADAGFCYDGDADRLIAADERGELVDGDKILCALAFDLQERGKLAGGCVVGTAHTNAGAERALAARGIRLLRADVGDKYVAEAMRRSGAVLGGEQSGHVILSEYAVTGDGILTSLRLASLLQKGPLSSLTAVRLWPQCNRSVKVQDKVRVLGSEGVQAAIEAEKAGVTRLVVRASGTEPVVRVFAEAETLSAARAAAGRICEACARAER